jgi:phosphoribosylglycinamide formyltransferase-1
MSGRIVVLVSGTGSNMSALIDACEAGIVPGEVVAVIADRDCVALRAAEKRGIETCFLEPSDFSSRAEWSEALARTVADRVPDLVVSAGFMRILAPAFVDSFPGKLINLHPSLLPAFPGAHAVRDALEFGARVTGTTVHFIDNEVDHGAIVSQRAVAIEPADTEGSLHERIKAVEHEVLPKACRAILEGRVRLEGGRVVTTTPG